MIRENFKSPFCVCIFLFFLMLDFNAWSQPPQPGGNNGGGNLEGDDVPVMSAMQIFFLILTGLLFVFYYLQKLKSKQIQ